MRTRPLVLGLVAVTIAAGAMLSTGPVTDAGRLSSLAVVPAPVSLTPRTVPTSGSAAASSAAGTVRTVPTGSAGLLAPVAQAPSLRASTSVDVALKRLGTLAVKGRAAKTGYSRAAFGPAWADVDRNGCDTRNDILNRDLLVLTRKPGTRGCVVLTGTLDDPYTGTLIAFRRGRSTSAAVQIDHVVALANAWQTGAAYFTAAQRKRLANDPRELLAVDGSSNASKGDGDTATWLPPFTSYRCAYVTRQIEVKTAYRLWVTGSEKAAMARVLARCGGDDAPVPTPVAEPSPAVDPTPVVDPPAPDPGVSYQNCDAVRAAGAAPLRAGAPGYSRKLDRDGDGVACE